MQQKIYTVRQLNTVIKAALEYNLPNRLTISGEVTNFKPASSGHWYFSLKDAGSVVPCVMWRSKTARSFTPENGMAILATGSVDVYVPHGRYQLIADKLEPAGTGALQIAFEQLVKKLRAEGLFEEKHKKPLPPYPERIAIITSETGAAVHDITDSIHNRWPCVKLLLYPVPVQGKGSAEKIAFALNDVNNRNNKLKIDLLIVGRGGGSLEDLWAFNEEPLARAIFNSSIPIISAVGHEVDTTIADLVADARASTPTRAGVAAVPDITEVMDKLNNTASKLLNNVSSRTEMASQRLLTIKASSAFRNPLIAIFNRQQQIDEIYNSLSNRLKNILTIIREKLQNSRDQIEKIEPHRLLATRKIEINNLSRRAFSAQQQMINKTTMGLNNIANTLPETIRSKVAQIRGMLERSLSQAKKTEPYKQISKHKISLNKLNNRVLSAQREMINKKNIQLTRQISTLTGLNPKSVLSRGYSITTSARTGKVITGPHDLEQGERIITELAEKKLVESEVIKKDSHNQNALN